MDVKSELAEKLAHVTISAGMEKIFARGDDNGVMSSASKQVVAEVNKLDIDNTSAMICMAVEKSTQDGVPGYAISGGICGTVEVLAGLLLIISSKIDSIREGRPADASVQ